VRAPDESLLVGYAERAKCVNPTAVRFPNMRLQRLHRPVNVVGGDIQLYRCARFAGALRTWQNATARVVFRPVLETVLILSRLLCSTGSISHSQGIWCKKGGLFGRAARDEPFVPAYYFHRVASSSANVLPAWFSRLGRPIKTSLF